MWVFDSVPRGACVDRRSEITETGRGVPNAEFNENRNSTSSQRATCLSLKQT